MRQIVLDTETTGLEPEQGHRIIEVGCVELLNRRLTGNDLHLYINPDRAIEEGAEAVHGISVAFLADKPRFAEIADELLEYLGDAELVIHNAPFDLGFLNAELRRLQPQLEPLEQRLSVVDTLVAARRQYPGQRNSLDALCKRFAVDDSARDLHGALLDAQLLAHVYRHMTGGQTTLSLAAQTDHGTDADHPDLARQLAASGKRPRVIRASPEEVAVHEAYLRRLAATGDNGSLWREPDTG